MDKSTKSNVDLIAGSILIFGLVCIAILGPQISPHDPMQENFTLMIDGQVKSPPYPAFTIPGFPLGTDNFGRDIFSRLLWAIRPTLLMVIIVASIRLIIGLIVGLIAGWYDNSLGKILQELTSHILSVPILIVALIGITAVGINKGLVAFIFGLAITGWAETARIVEGRTRLIKNQIYIEASKALGASDTVILVSHVFNQVLPLIWMLLSFEVSNTFLVVAELGFLGYFIGGGIWMEVSDFVVVNIEGLPELGQMLSSAMLKLTDPSALLAIGSMIFIAILGFNLLGEGLRQRTSLETRNWDIWQKIFGKKIGKKLMYETFPDVSFWVGKNLTGIFLSGVFVLSILSFSRWVETRPTPASLMPVEILPVPGDHYWATEKHDAHGTRWTNIIGPKQPKLLWFYYAGGEFVAGPAITDEGVVIAASNTKQLVALNTDGTLKWSTRLEQLPIGTPALGERGEIYVTDNEGDLTAYAPNGGILWQFKEPTGRGSVSGPIVARNGTIFYSRVNTIQAATLFGKPLWFAPTLDTYEEEALVLSPQESFLFLKKLALAAESGARLKVEQFPLDEMIFGDPTFFVGADNHNYFRNGGDIYRWRSVEGGVEIDDPVGWSFNISNSPIFPNDQGVTPQGTIWMFYGSDWMETRLVALDQKGRILSNVNYGELDGDIIGIDRENIAYFCSSNFGLQAMCRAVKLGSDQPIWELELGNNAQIVGGAIAPGRLYVTLKSGYLLALGD